MSFFGQKRYVMSGRADKCRPNSSINWRLTKCLQTYLLFNMIYFTWCKNLKKKLVDTFFITYIYPLIINMYILFLIANASTKFLSSPEGSRRVSSMCFIQYTAHYKYLYIKSFLYIINILYFDDNIRGTYSNWQIYITGQERKPPFTVKPPLIIVLYRYLQVPRGPYCTTIMLCTYVWRQRVAP